jgi:hypothetical protein
VGGGRPRWRRLRVVFAIAVPLAALTLYLIARYPADQGLIVDGVFLPGNTLLVIWLWRERLDRGLRAQATRWLLLLLAVTVCLDLALWAGLLTRWRAASAFVLFAVVCAVCYWLAVSRFGYRPARLSPGRVAIIAALAGLSGTLLYGMWRWRGSLGHFAGLGWVFATVALFRALLRRRGRESSNEDA